MGMCSAPFLDSGALARRVLAVVLLWIAVGLVIMASLGVRKIPSFARQPSVPKEGG